MTTQASIQEAHYRRFVEELTALSRKYGVAIQSIGGVYLANTQGEFRDLSYSADISSGDLCPQWPQSPDSHSP